MAESDFNLSISKSMLSPAEIDNLFLDSGMEAPEDKNSSKKSSSDSKPDNGKQEDDDNTTENRIDDTLLFNSESVGSEDDDDDSGDTVSNDDGSSPSGKFYSSIAEAFVKDGIFLSLDEESVADVRSAEDLAEVIENEITARLDERAKRIDAALSSGLEPSTINQYESTLNYLNSLDDRAITAETKEGAQLRQNLIFNDYVDKGYSQERARREVDKSFKGGTDIADAKDAVISLRESYKSSYDELVNEAKAKVEEEKKRRYDSAQELKKHILEDEKAFGGLEVDKATRRKVFDTISKVVQKDSKTGEQLNAMQVYERQNPTEFLKNIALVFTLTDGFKDINKMIGGKVKKEIKKGLRELEAKLNNTSRTSDGNLRFASGASDSKNERHIQGGNRDWDIYI